MQESVETLLATLPRAPEEEEKLLRELYCDLLGAHQRGVPNLPALQPVSLTNQNLHASGSLTQDPRGYLLGEKTDGLRVVLFGVGGRWYFVGRRFDFLQVDPTHLPSLRALDDVTILDGELVAEELEGGGGVLRPCYIVFDAPCVNGRLALRQPLAHRLLLARCACFGSRPLASEAEAEQPPPLDLALKQFMPLCHFDTIVSQIVGDCYTEVHRRAKHGNDGLILMRANVPYHPGPFSGTMKWKPQKQASVDMRLQRVPDARHGALRFVGAVVGSSGRLEPYAPIELDPVDREAFAALSDDELPIIECWYDAAHGAWRYKRVRTDKPTPNALQVVHDVVRSIRDDIKQSELRQFAKSLAVTETSHASALAHAEVASRTVPPQGGQWTDEVRSTLQGWFAHASDPLVEIEARMKGVSREVFERTLQLLHRWEWSEAAVRRVTIDVMHESGVRETRREGEDAEPEYVRKAQMQMVYGSLGPVHVKFARAREEPCAPDRSAEVGVRRKERCSFFHKLFRYDLTKVTSGWFTTYEIELEFRGGAATDPVYMAESMLCKVADLAHHSVEGWPPAEPFDAGAIVRLLPDAAETFDPRIDCPTTRPVDGAASQRLRVTEVPHWMVASVDGETVRLSNLACVVHGLPLPLLHVVVCVDRRHVVRADVNPRKRAFGEPDTKVA